MNNFFNFFLPVFQSDNGEDWTDFLSIMEDNIDESINKTYQLAWLNDINRISIQAAEKTLDSLGIPYDVSDTLFIKKNYLRTFLTKFIDKGLAEMYLVPQEEIVGTRGVVYLGLDFGTLRWGYSRWADSGGTPATEDIKWSTETSKFCVYIDCKTADSGELDSIVAIYRQNFMLPAFYQIYLIDSTFAILRTV